MRTIALLVLLSSFSAFACPNLAGKYATCRSVSGEGSSIYDLVVTQSVQNKITTYVLTSMNADTNESESTTFRADGKTIRNSQTDPDSGSTMSLATTVSCVGKAVNVKMVLIFDSEEASKLLISFTKEGNQFIQVTTGNSMGEEINETVICE